MDRAAHFEALLARLRERQGLTVHDTNAPLDEKQRVVRGTYVVLHDLGPDEYGDERYTAPQTADSAATMRVVARCVGEDANAVRKISGVVRRQFLRWAPTVTGRTCWPLVLDEEGEIEEDKDVSPPLPFADIDFTYRTTPGG